VGVVSVSDVLRAGSAATADACSLPPSGYLKNAGLGYELGRRELAQLLRTTVPPGRTVGEIMTRNVIQVEAGSSALAALQIMHARGIHRVFVTRSARVIGVISQGSLLAGLAAAPAEEAVKVESAA
jgi:signal-transduction protein with cAMP-binding, CBS, and nucleotidyltransferase domain